MLPSPSRSACAWPEIIFGSFGASGIINFSSSGESAPSSGESAPYFGLLALLVVPLFQTRNLCDTHEFVWVSLPSQSSEAWSWIEEVHDKEKWSEWYGSSQR